MLLVSDRSIALTHIEEAIDSNLVTMDLDTVVLYEVAFEHIMPQQQESWAGVIGELRWQFVKANAKDEDASMECFKSCLLNDDLDHAIKVCWW